MLKGVIKVNLLHHVGELHFWPLSKESKWMFITKIVAVDLPNPNNRGPYRIDWWTGPQDGRLTRCDDGSDTRESDTTFLEATPISRDKALTLLSLWGFRGRDLEL